MCCQIYLCNHDTVHSIQKKKLKVIIVAEMLKYLDDLCLLSYDTDCPQFIMSMCASVWKTNNFHLLFAFVQTALHTVVVCAGTNEFGTGSLHCKDMPVILCESEQVWSGGFDLEPSEINFHSERAFCTWLFSSACSVCLRLKHRHTHTLDVSLCGLWEKSIHVHWGVSWFGSVRPLLSGLHGIIYNVSAVQNTDGRETHRLTRTSLWKHSHTV